MVEQVSRFNACPKTDFLRVVQPRIAKLLNFLDGRRDSVVDLLVQLLLRFGDGHDEVGSVTVSR